MKACRPVVISTTITEQAEPYRAPVCEPRPTVYSGDIEKEVVFDMMEIILCRIAVLSKHKVFVQI